MRRPLLLALLIALDAAAGCAGRPPGAAIARLEAKRAAHPDAARTLRALGIAYYDAGRYAEAGRALARAHELMPADGVTALYLGMSAEQSGDLRTARASYESYVRQGRTSRVRRQLRAKLAALARKELEAQARQAVAEESALGAAAGSPTTVAVMPLDFNGADTTLASLGRGVADLIVTDLSRSAQLTVVERDRLAALLGEIARSRSGAVDSTTIVRAGRLARAGRMVRGSITQLAERSLRADAAVVDVGTARLGAPLGTDFDLDAVFDAEKRIVLGVFADMGIALTPSERAAIEQRPTKSLAAFLAYSRGLVAEDAGRYGEAARLFEDAVRLDPDFRAARSAATRAKDADEGASVTPATIESALAGTSEGAIVSAAVAGTEQIVSLAATAEAARDAINPSLAAVAAGATILPAIPVKQGPAIATGGGDIVTINAGQIVIKVPLP